MVKIKLWDEAVADTGEGLGEGDYACRLGMAIAQCTVGVIMRQLVLWHD